MKKIALTILLVTFGFYRISAWAGAQKYEALADSVRTALHAAVSDDTIIAGDFRSADEREQWINEMSQRLFLYMEDAEERRNFLAILHYEAKRAGLDPQMVLGLITVESKFRRYAVSRAGARGYMQVMPFWVELIGDKGHNLFNTRTNLRYGCTILRHYLDIENGVLFRALGRYNGSLGQEAYPNLVRAAWYRKWTYAEQ